MEEAINITINDFISDKKISCQINRDYKKAVLLTKDIVIDAELLKVILLNTKIDKKEGYDYDYFYYITPSFKFYISENINNNNDIDLNFSYLLSKYSENNISIYKFITIFQELVEDKKINVKETNFTKYNSDEIKVFTKFLICSINKTKIDFDNFIYIKFFDINKLKESIKNKEIQKSDKKFVKIIENFGEILEIFDEIYDTKIFTELENGIIEYNKIQNNKLFITEKENKFVMQIFIKKEYFNNIVELIKKIKNNIKDLEIILYVEQSIDDFYLLFKEGFINNLIIKHTDNKNLIMLKNNKDLFIYYDLEIDSSYKIVENFFNEIKKFLDGYFETLYLVFNKNYKIHKIKISSLSNFGYFIKDKVFQNYFKLNEYNEEIKYYSVYLYSKNNRLCYDIFCLIDPVITKPLSFWLNYGNKKIIDKPDSLILINGYELILKSAKIVQNIYYNKIILQIDNNDQYQEEFNNALNRKNIEFHTKNIYYVKSLKEYIDENKYIPTTTLTTYKKRGFDTLVPFFDFVYKKKPILNKKPIIVQISYFLSYNLNIYGINNSLDK